MLLTVLTFLPALGALLVAVYPAQKEREILWISFWISTVTFLGSLCFFCAFDASGGFQFGLPAVSWIPSIGISFQLSLDGISVLLYLLTTFVMPLAILSADGHIKTRKNSFYALLLLLETAMLGAFAAMDLFLFYVFWELMLIPMYFIIGMWGGPRRVYATIKFFLFTMAGSLPMFLAILYVYFRYRAQFPGATSLDWASLERLDLSPEVQGLLFAAFALSFAVKVPLFPLHTWLPDAHVEAPTAGSIVLAAILLKMGGYGFLRFGLPLFPVAAHAFQPYLMALAVVGVIYGALVAMVQEDVKKLIAYSSVSHMAMVLLGIFSFDVLGVQGGIYQMLGHGLSTGALFLLVGILYDRRHTRAIDQFGGVARVMPWYAAAFLLVTLASIGLPGTSGFIGEFLILAGVFRSDPWMPEVAGTGRIAAGLAGTGVILGAWYMLRMYRHVFFGEVTREENRRLKDVTGLEFAAFAPFLAFIILLGVYPQPFLSKSEKSVEKLVRSLEAAAPADESPSGAPGEHGGHARQVTPGPLGPRLVGSPDRDEPAASGVDPGKPLVEAGRAPGAPAKALTR
ncbi:MAG: NADH-quinone oxidoreductase subunit M [Planctomycetes bacterium]|nr:NADH-quinone oxidoreductase subunit M [Planctomycetota bacterium]